ncbi:MAG TPA: GNAT family N-acetyltransferase [Casimicrobiaceae bacterium]|nr:GNAT family N-acetyltransferase [Casimicrobiaceae bacterium]
MSELSTPRLTLRHFRREDVDDLFSMDSDDRVMRYLGAGLKGRTRAEVEQTIERMVERANAHPGYGLLHASLRDGGAFVGGCGLFPLQDTQDIEIAYRLPFARWGKGFATEMAAAVLVHGFDGLGLARVVGLTWPENAPSQRVLEKIGMRFAGEAVHYGRTMRTYAASR